MHPQEAHIFFVDDDPNIRAVVQEILESAGIHVRVFSSAQDCLAGLNQHNRCDLLITDFKMNGMDGLALIREVKTRLPWVPTVMMTCHGDIPLAVSATKAGATEFIEKPCNPQALLSAIQKVLENAIRPELLLQRRLSDAEVQIVRNILDGKTSREISHSLHRSIRTVEVHRRNIMRKLGVRNVAELIRKAFALGFDNDGRVGGDGD
jgi:two-component system response regulator FixJ